MRGRVEGGQGSRQGQGHHLAEVLERLQHATEGEEHLSRFVAPPELANALRQEITKGVGEMSKMRAPPAISLLPVRCGAFRPSDSPLTSLAGRGAVTLE